jgi:hypothetical protein
MTPVLDVLGTIIVASLEIIRSYDVLMEIITDPKFDSGGMR